MATSLDKYNKTKKYKFYYIKNGREWSATIEKHRFSKVDQILSNMYQICGDGIISGWNVETKDDNAIISSGSGIVDGFFVENNESVTVALNKDVTNYIFAKIKDGLPYPKLDDLKKFLNELGDPPDTIDYKDVQSHIVAVREHNKKLRGFMPQFEWDSNDENLFNVVEFIVTGKEQVEKAVLICEVLHDGSGFVTKTEGVTCVGGHLSKHLSFTDTATKKHSHSVDKIDLKNDTIGILGVSNIKDIDASCFISGKISPEQVSAVDHNNITSSTPHDIIEDKISIFTSGLPKKFAKLVFENNAIIKAALQTNNTRALPTEKLAAAELETIKVELQDGSKNKNAVISIVAAFENNDKDKARVCKMLAGELDSLLKDYEEVVFDVVCPQIEKATTKLNLSNLNKVVPVVIDLFNPSKTIYFFKTKDIIQTGSKCNVDDTELEVIGSRHGHIVCKGDNFDIVSSFILFGDEHIEFDSFRKLLPFDNIVSKYGFSGLKEGEKYSIGSINMVGQEIVFTTSSSWNNAEFAGGVDEPDGSGESEFIAKKTEIFSNVNSGMKFNGSSLEIEFYGANTDKVIFFIETKSGYRMEWPIIISGKNDIVPFEWIGETNEIETAVLCDRKITNGQVCFEVNEDNGFEIEEKSELGEGMAKTTMFCEHPDLQKIPVYFGENEQAFGCSHSIKAKAYNQTVGEIDVDFISPVNIFGKYSAKNKKLEQQLVGECSQPIYVTKLGDEQIEIETKIFDKFSLSHKKDVHTIVLFNENMDASNIVFGERADLYRGVEEITESMGEDIESWNVLIDDRDSLDQGKIKKLIKTDSNGVVLVFNSVDFGENDRYTFLKTDVILVTDEIYPVCKDIQNNQDDQKKHKEERKFVDESTIFVPINKVLVDFQKINKDDLIKILESVEKCDGFNIEDASKISEKRKNSYGAHSKTSSETDNISYLVSDKKEAKRHPISIIPTSNSKNTTRNILEKIVDLGDKRLLNEISIEADIWNKLTIETSIDCFNWEPWNSTDNRVCRYIKALVEYEGSYFDAKMKVSSYKPSEKVVTPIETENSCFIEKFVFEPCPENQGISDNKKEVYLEKSEDGKCKIVNLHPHEIDISSLMLLYNEENGQDLK